MQENFDMLINSSPDPTIDNDTSHVTRRVAIDPSEEYCESCGLTVQTKYVEFYENIGMIIMRRHRSIKGKFCKSCIDYYFWNMTGKTMLLGWWGIISFIVTPFILINNFFRFAFTLGMKKLPLSIFPKPSPLWVSMVIGGILLFGFFLFNW